MGQRALFAFCLSEVLEPLANSSHPSLPVPAAKPQPWCGRGSVQDASHCREAAYVGLSPKVLGHSHDSAPLPLR